MLIEPIINWLNHKASKPEVPLCDFEKMRHELKPCDVILIEGRSRVSEVIKLITQSPWSHAALYIGRIHDIEDETLRNALGQHYEGDASDQIIIESELGCGTILRPLSYYKGDHIRISRPVGLTFNDAQDVIRYCVSRLGYDYDVRQILDLARLLFPWWIMPRQWRSSLFASNPGGSTKTVCSTMIAEAFSFVQFPILPLVKLDDDQNIQLFRRNPKLCVPSDFDYSPYFEIIKYPYLDYQNQLDYRLLPWSGDVEFKKGSIIPFQQAKKNEQ